MSKIRIRNFGPIKVGLTEDDGWLDINKVTVFIGNQGSGKSTVAKLISIFTWLEKALVRGDHTTKWFGSKGRFRSKYLTYHRIENYLRTDTVIEYEGDAYSMQYYDGKLSIKKNEEGGLFTPQNNPYSLPQIMYVPAERNFLAYIKGAKTLRISGALQDFNMEYYNALQVIKGTKALPINNTNIEYNRQYDIVNLRGTDYKIRLTEAASGFQSLTPLYLVSDYLSNSVKSGSKTKEPMSADESNKFKKEYSKIINSNLPDGQKDAAISVLSSRYNKTAFVNIVEEPEQNLFPSSQWKILQSLLELNNTTAANKLILTTHSPYLINYLTLAIKTRELKDMAKGNSYDNELSEIVPLGTMIVASDLSIYELDELRGTISPLETFYGLPSDENKLNEMLGEGDDLFSKLLDIEQNMNEHEQQ